MSEPNITEIVADGNGRLTLAGFTMLADMNARIVVMEGTLAAIAAITAPTGGATTDAEARSAIAAILAEAG